MIHTFKIAGYIVRNPEGDVVNYSQDRRMLMQFLSQNGLVGKDAEQFIEGNVERVYTRSILGEAPVYKSRDNLVEEVK